MKVCHVIEKEHKEYDEFDRYTVSHSFHCSACEYEFETSECPYCNKLELIRNYCPNCGAEIQE